MRSELLGLITRRGRRLGMWAKDSPEAPPAPDFLAAAKETAAGNRTNSLEALQNNRITQNTPFGSITYTKDKNGNWVQNLNYSSAQQGLLNRQNQISSQIAGQLGTYLKRFGGSLTGDAGKVGQDALMARYQPQINQDRQALQAQLANQGIMQGSEAYNNAMRTQGQQENDLYRQAGLYGLEAGQKMQDHYMNLLGAARQGDAAALVLVDELCLVMGRMLYNLVVTLDLQAISIGGSVFWHHRDFLLPRLKPHMDGHLSSLTAGVKILPAGLQDKVGDYAALALVV
jgi:hypothetical protein